MLFVAMHAANVSVRGLASKVFVLVVTRQTFIIVLKAGHRAMAAVARDVGVMVGEWPGRQWVPLRCDEPQRGDEHYAHNHAQYQLSLQHR